MTWFKVDDSFHSHPKTLAISLGAVGLWTVAGSWSSDHHTDGFVPDFVIPQLSRGLAGLADELVVSRLWRRTRGGYQFHQFNEDGDGSVRNPTRSEVMTRRANQSSGGEIGNHRRWHVGKGVRKSGCRYCQQEQNRSTDQIPDQSTDTPTESLPSPPVPSRPGPSSGGSSRGRRPVGRRATRERPLERCPEHINDDRPPPCGACADARRAVEAWDRGSAVDITAAVRACSLCDADGWRWIDPKRRGHGVMSGPDARCDHLPVPAGVP